MRPPVVNKCGKACTNANLWSDYTHETDHVMMRWLGCARACVRSPRVEAYIDISSSPPSLPPWSLQARPSRRAQCTCGHPPPGPPCVRHCVLGVLLLQQCGRCRPRRRPGMDSGLNSLPARHAIVSISVLMSAAPVIGWKMSKPHVVNTPTAEHE
jgi:hypothetical protein